MVKNQEEKSESITTQLKRIGSVATGLMSLVKHLRNGWLEKAENPFGKTLTQQIERTSNALTAILLAVSIYCLLSKLWGDVEMMFAALICAALVVSARVLVSWILESRAYLSRKDGQDRWIYGGMYLNKASRAKLRGQDLAPEVDKPDQVQTLFEGAWYAEEALWSSNSKSLTKLIYELALITYMTAGTTGIGIAATLLASLTWRSISK